MSKANHRSLKYKQRAKPNKTYKELKMKQKQLVSTLMFRCTYEFYSDNGKLPEENDYDSLAHKVYALLEVRSIWVPFDEFYNKGFLKKIDRILERVNNGEIYIKPEKKDKDKKQSKPANPKKFARTADGK